MHYCLFDQFHHSFHFDWVTLHFPMDPDRSADAILLYLEDTFLRHRRTGRHTSNTARMSDESGDYLQLEELSRWCSVHNMRTWRQKIFDNPFHNTADRLCPYTRHLKQFHKPSIYNKKRKCWTQFDENKVFAFHLKHQICHWRSKAIKAWPSFNSALHPAQLFGSNSLGLVVFCRLSCCCCCAVAFVGLVCCCVTVFCFIVPPPTQVSQRISFPVFVTFRKIV